MPQPHPGNNLGSLVLLKIDLPGMTIKGDISSRRQGNFFWGRCSISVQFLIIVDALYGARIRLLIAAA
jgi:hypothetical protein